MDRQYIDDQHIVARYLADQLSDREREAFETYYLEHPEVVKELEAAARLKAGLMHLQESGELEQLTRRPASSSGRQLLAAAAAVAAIAFGVLLVIDRDVRTTALVTASLTELAPPIGSIPVASTHQLIRTRSARGTDAEIEVPKPAGAIQLLILPEYEDSSNRYRTVVTSTANGRQREIGSATGLVPNEDGFVAIYLSSEGFSAGEYEVELSGETPPVAHSSTFRIRIADPTADFP